MSFVTFLCRIILSLLRVGLRLSPLAATRFPSPRRTFSATSRGVSTIYLRLLARPAVAPYQAS
jgi:hypothetical protein